MMQKPDVEQIDGLSPAISIEQKTTSRNPRSTVGTVTEIYDYLRLLFARVGIPYSPATGLPIESQTVSQMVDKVMALPEGTRLFLLAPIARGRKGEYKRELNDLMRKGFQRVKIDGEFHDIEDAPNLDKKIKHDIEVVVDRHRRRAGYRDAPGRELRDGAEARRRHRLRRVRRREGCRTATPRRITFSEKFACPVSGFTIAEIEPRLFSFNNPFGACPVCDGLGTEQKIDPNLIVSDVTLSLRDGAIVPWSQDQRALLPADAASGGQALWRARPARRGKTCRRRRRTRCSTAPARPPIKFVYDDGLRTYKTTKPFEGVIGNLERRYKETESAGMREEIEKYMSSAPCVACNGYRLKPEALAVKIDGLHIGQVSEKSIRAAAAWFEELPAKLTATQNQIGERVFKEIRERLGFLNDVGLDYLTLARNSGSLSGGESQRIRLASQIGSGLTGVLYVLDEPSIGLHQRDNARLLETLRRLRDIGNTVIVVEHDEDAILTRRLRASTSVRAPASMAGTSSPRARPTTS